ncbi:MAG: LamG-like jellyroll fold domain-containing protein, partial [Planctomycetota bacterium]
MCRKLIYLISFVLMLGLCPHLAHGEAGLVGYWKLDELSGTTAIDSAGGDNDGMLRGFRLQWKPSEGKVGGALSYGGDPQSYVTFPTTGMSATAGTIALWGYLDDPQPGQTRYFFGHTTIPSWANRIQIYMDDPTNMLDIGLGYTHSHAIDLLSLETQTWYHIALTWDDAGTCVVYINGEEMTRGPYSGLTTLNTEADIGNNGDRDGRDQGFGGLIDEVRLYNRALTQAEIQKVMTFQPVLATNPSPADGATDVPRDVVLSWTPGIYALAVNGHKVYFSENFNDVSDGIGGVTQSAASYTPPQRLNLATTYYWRVDEVNNVNPDSPWIGDVWSFTTELFAYPIDGNNIIATASSQFNADNGPEKTIDGSGLDENDLHSKEQVAIWVSSMTGPQPTWIQYEFDRVYKLHQMWIWNHNTAIELAVGLGIKDATIEYSIDGANWTTLGTTHEFARAPGTPGYAHNTTIDLSGVVAKYVKITANSNWGGIVSQYGLSEVRFFHIPVNGREPYPDSGATGVDVDVVLSFRAGREAAQHDVYISTDEQAVIDGTAPVTTVTETSYGPLSLDLGETYYWKVNEVNEAETPATWQGELWSFTTREFLVVDDFESYNDLDTTDPESNRIFHTWIDGLDQPTNGSLVGYESAPFCEKTIVHGGDQSMPFFYANTGGAAFSEAELTLSPSQDWTAGGAKVLSLWFFGDASNTAGQMYVKVNGTKVAYDNPGKLALSGWQVW